MPQTSIFRYFLVFFFLFSSSIESVSAQQNAIVDSSVKELRKKISALLTTNGKHSKISAHIYSIDRNEEIFFHNPDMQSTPASTTKLFSTYAAFQLMGANYQIPTQVFTDAAETKNGVLEGNLYIVGHGDALLTISDIEQLADQIEHAGIVKIRGSVFGDGSYFGGSTQRHIYSGDGEIVEPLPPVTALGYYRNSVAAMVYGGNPLRMQFIPPSDAFVPVIRSAPPAKTPKKNSRKKNRAVRKSTKKQLPAKKSKKPPVVKKKKKYSDAEYAAYPLHQYWGDAAPLPKTTAKKRRGRSGVTVSTSVGDDSRQYFTVSGSLPRGAATTKYFLIAKPELAVAGSLVNRLRGGGVEVLGSPGVKKSPLGARLLAEVKRPVTEMLNLVNKNSDNFLAEQTFKMVGAYNGGQINTAAAAVKAIADEVTESGIGGEDFCLNDGSGLCRKNLLSAKNETNLLVKAAQSSFAKEFAASLPTAGVDGTLRKRMIGTPAQNNLRAKTGTLRNVSALAGYVHTVDGEHLAFAFIWNGPNVGLYKQTENAIGALLASFSRNASTMENIQSKQ